MSRSEFELSLRWSTESESERQFIRARYLEGTADLLMRRGKRS
jgi:hypothetical protein